MIITRDNTALGAARAELALRKRRNAALGGELFGEPAWDMLLELFVALCEERQMTVGELCAVAGVPPSTAYRWLLTLERKGKVRRVTDILAPGVELVTLTLAERERLSEMLRMDQ